MNLNSIVRKFCKFAAVGFTSTVINYGIFFVAAAFFHVYYAWAFVFGYVSGAIFGYFYNRSWTFSPITEKRYKEFGVYFLIYALSLAVSVSALQVLVEQAGLNLYLAAVLSIGISMVTNFLGCNFIVFDQRRIAQIEKVSKFFTPAFFWILAIKIIGSFYFGSHYIVQGFLPFVDYFSRTFLNPYQHFFQAHQMVFPYPGGMLWVLSLPYAVLLRILPHQLFASLNFQLLVLRLPLLIADVLLYIILCLMLPTKQKSVLWLYFASPILFYINYFHGQLDVIPTALLFLSIFALFRGRNWYSFLFLGLGIACKTHLLAVLPFYWIYLYRNHFSLRKIIALTLAATVVLFACNPFLGSPGFLAMVLNNPEQQRLFFLALPFTFDNLMFYMAPAAILFILYRFASYKRLNLDSLLLTLGLTYIVLIALVPPMQGWYYWSLPFLIFFFIKFDGGPFGLWMLSALYLLYFVIAKDSDIFESLRPLSLHLSALPNPFHYLAMRGVSPSMLENLSFTALESTLIACSVWAYSVGTTTTELFQKKKKRFVLGVAGDSGVGKSTLVNVLGQIFGNHNAVFLNGDDVHKWERGDAHWQNVTHLNPKGNYVHTDLEHLLALLRGEKIQRLSYDHGSGKFIGPVELVPNNFIVSQGLMPFMLDRMRDLHDLKIFMETDEALRQKWKTQRDRGERGHTEQSVSEQIQIRKPDAERFIYPQKPFADWIIRYLPLNEPEDYMVEYRFKNSVFLDALTDELAKIGTLKIEHNYTDSNYQQVSLSGKLPKEQVSELAYKLYPNIFDLVENQPVFLDDLKGLHQLFFINYLNHFYRLRLRHEEFSSLF